MKKYKNNKILIATGGTGGHVFPALSLAKHFIKNQYLVEIVTDVRGMRFLNKYPELKLTLIKSGTIFKKNIFKIIISFFVIIFSFFKSLLILIKRKPFLVFGMGGYSSFPICLAAKILKIPFIIYENNLLLGKSNRYLLPFAHKIFVSYSELEGVNKKYSNKVALIGNIIRDEILNFKTTNKNNDILSILILGGSQAAKSFGDKLPPVFQKCIEENIKIKIFQQCVASQNETLKEKFNSLNIDFKLFNFSDNILEYFSKVDLVITRSGASIIAELVNCNIPFISIPFPHAADNHQEKNAVYFKNKGFGFLIHERDIALNLLPLIKSIYKDKKILKEISDKQNIYSDKKVFKKIDNEIKKLIND